MKYDKINKNAVKSWYIDRIIFIIIFAPIYWGVVYKLLIPKFRHISFLKYGLDLFTIVIGVYLMLNTFLFPIIEYREWRYKITEDKIEMIYGMIIRRKIIIPISRIQHLDIEQGFIYRRFGLASLNINTAGASHELPALTLAEAEEISEKLKDRIEKSDTIE
ncbi:PH domain-containing protein [Maledivibacter halophilus]|uniref:YdbS-like PH domain-containing protein n=1 Tax=Maledivibacter halophilus TaxID=36842 RepID=A0A1T5LK25_9FIRM|nr:PH domain-containing protein [Maledivibacter halophilus]SKC76341.1 hypothetical protein SAMN02194393_02972 [Maledivibacter halophilus]